MKNEEETIASIVEAIGIEPAEKWQGSVAHIEFDDLPSVTCEARDGYLTFDGCIAVLPYQKEPRARFLESVLRRSLGQMRDTGEVLYFDENESSIRLNRRTELGANARYKLVEELAIFVEEISKWVEFNRTLSNSGGGNRMHLQHNTLEYLKA